MRGSAITSTSSRATSRTGFRLLSTRNSARPTQSSVLLPSTINHSFAPRRHILSFFRSALKSESSPDSSASESNTSSADNDKSSNGHAEPSQPSEPTDADRTKELISSRLKQDPFGRIRLIRPYGDMSKVVKTTRRMSNVNPTIALFGDVTKVEAHCLPFWSVITMLDFHEASWDRSSGKRYGSANWATDMGCSVAAVGRDHWAHGMVLPDGPRELLQALEDYADVNPYGSRAEHMIEQHNFTPSQMPEFAMGYPQITDEAYGRLFSAHREHQVLTYKGMDNAGTSLSSRRAVEYAAIPTYRIVYKLWLFDGTRSHQGFWDGQFWNPWDEWHHHDQSYGFVLRDQPPQFNNYNFVPESVFKTWVKAVGSRTDGEKTDFDDAYEELFPQSCAHDTEGMKRWADLLYQTQLRSTLNWNDPNILSADIDDRDNVKDLVHYATMSTLKSPLPKRPRWQACIPEEPKFIPNTTPSPSLPPRRPKPVQQPSRPSPPEEPTAKPAPTVSYAARLRKPGVPPRPPPRSSPSSPPPTARSFKFPTPADPKSLYATLRVDVNPVYLDPYREAEANQLLKDSWRALMMDYHPDKAAQLAPTMTGSIDEIRKFLEEKSTDINNAYEPLKTLKLRQYYQQHGNPA